jgi:hypothetical protein
MAHMLATFAQFEHRLIGQRTREALAVKRASGVRLGRPPTVPESVVRRIQRQRARGDSLRAIADTLNRDGVPTAQGGAQCTRRRYEASSLARPEPAMGRGGAGPPPRASEWVGGPGREGAWNCLRTDGHLRTFRRQEEGGARLARPLRHGARAVKDRPAPMLATLLELAADALELGDGTQRLELTFVDGRLRSCRKCLPFDTGSAGRGGGNRRLTISQLSMSPEPWNTGGGALSPSTGGRVRRCLVLRCPRGAASSRGTRCVARGRRRCPKPARP